MMQTVRQGNRGFFVTILQEALNGQGFGKLAVDGVFGPSTFDAVTSFQMSESLTPDGIVGPMTWARLLNTSPELVVPSGLHEMAARVPLPQRAALEFALADLGRFEDPPGSNGGPGIDHLVTGYREFHKVSREDMPGNPPWCAIAVSAWTAFGLGLGTRAAGVNWSKHPFGTWQGAVAAMERWASQHDAFVEPEPGAIFTMSREGSASDPSSSLHAGHCGLVLAVDAPGGFVTTVEGNVSNAVVSRIRHLKTLRRFIRWW